MENEDFENADIVFITDGECALPQDYLGQLQREQTAQTAAKSIFERPPGLVHKSAEETTDGFRCRTGIDKILESPL